MSSFATFFFRLCIVYGQAASSDFVCTLEMPGSISQNVRLLTELGGLPSDGKRQALQEGISGFCLSTICCG